MESVTRLEASANSYTVACATASGLRHSVTRDVLLVDRAKLNCLEGGTHEETLRPQVNPKVKCQRFKRSKVLSRLLKDPRIR